MKTILCYGDSNTYGYDPRNGNRYPREIRWTTILQELLGNDYEVIAEGLNGRTTAYERIDEPFRNGLDYLIPCLDSHVPMDYIVFMLGTNDCNSNLNISAKDICFGMEKLILTTKKNIPEIQDHELEIIIVVPAAISNDYPNSPFADNLNADSVKKSKELASLYKELADKYHTKFLDCSGLEVSSLDAEHLTIESHKKLASLLANLIKF